MFRCQRYARCDVSELLALAKERLPVVRVVRAQHEVPYVWHTGALRRRRGWTEVELPLMLHLLGDTLTPLVQLRGIGIAEDERAGLMDGQHVLLVVSHIARPSSLPTVGVVACRTCIVARGVTHSLHWLAHGRR